MSFNTRIFGHSGIQQIENIRPKQYSADSVYTLVQPYTFSQVLSTSAVAVSSAPNVVTTTTILRIEVPDGQTIRYEINPPGRNVAASTNSPSLSGKDQFYFAPGWSVSVIDAAGLL